MNRIRTEKAAEIVAASLENYTFRAMKDGILSDMGITAELCEAYETLSGTEKGQPAEFEVTPQTAGTLVAMIDRYTIPYAQELFEGSMDWLCAMTGIRRMCLEIMKQNPEALEDENAQIDLEEEARKKLQRQRSAQNVMHSGFYEDQEEEYEDEEPEHAGFQSVYDEYER